MARGMKRAARALLFAIPVIAFAAVAALLGFGLGNDPSVVPSVLIGKPAPAFALPALDERTDGLSTADFAGGEISVVNIFASWCVPCRAEHPFVSEIAGMEGVALYGIAYKDAPADARRFLDELGDPYRRIGADPEGRAGIELGVYGVPETFFIGPDGIVRYKHIGPILPEHMERRIRPLIAGLRP